MNLIINDEINMKDMGFELVSLQKNRLPISNIKECKILLKTDSIKKIDLCLDKIDKIRSNIENLKIYYDSIEYVEIDVKEEYDLSINSIIENENKLLSFVLIERKE